MERTENLGGFNMKMVILKIKDGCVKILADGPYGAGTEDFTIGLANDLGIITERHIGYHHSHEGIRHEVEVRVRHE